MVKQSLYLLIASLMLVSCNESSSNVDEANGAKTSYTGILRQVSYTNARTEESNILYLIKDKCGSENDGLMVLSGDDTDLDGVLEYKEATEKSILCNGSDGQIVANTTDTKDGQAHIFSECGDNNGLAFSVAYDTDNDGLLNGNEILSNNYRVICETQNAIFDINHSEYYSTLVVKSGQTNTSINFYYPKVTILQPDANHITNKSCENGGYRIEMYNPSKDNRGASPTNFDLNQTICNGVDGKNGKTPVTTVIDGNKTIPENDKCQKTGGLKIALETDKPTYICNGIDGSASEDLNLSILSNNTGTYILEAGKKVSEDIAGVLKTGINYQTYKTEISKKSSTSACPFGELNITTYKLDDGVTKTELSSEIICSAEVITADALAISTALIKGDTNLSIDFKFNRLVNELMVDDNSIKFVCSSQSEQNKNVEINISHNINLTSDGVKDFNLVYSKESLPQPTNSINCSLKISKFIEDTNRVHMQNSYLKDFNFSVK